MGLKIKFKTDNAAFSDDCGGLHEAFLVLDHVKDRLISGAKSGNLRDSNGNTVGKWEWK